MGKVAAPGGHGSLEPMFVGSYPEFLHPFRLFLHIRNLLDGLTGESSLGLEDGLLSILEVVLRIIQVQVTVFGHRFFSLYDVCYTGLLAIYRFRLSPREPVVGPAKTGKGKLILKAFVLAAETFGRLLYGYDLSGSSYRTLLNAGKILGPVVVAPIAQ